MYVMELFICLVSVTYAVSRARLNIMLIDMRQWPIYGPLCGAGRSGYNNSQQRKTNVYSQKLPRKKCQAADGWRAAQCRGRLRWDPDPGADPQGGPGSQLEIVSYNVCQSWGALPWGFTRREICADRLRPPLMTIYRDLIFTVA